MKAATKISGEARRAAIIQAARDVFVHKGFYGTTTRELAAAAGVSEALLFKHFPSKEAIYSAILTSCFEEGVKRVTGLIETLQPSTASLVFLVQDFVSEVVGGQADEEKQTFYRINLRSLMEEGEFARHTLQGIPQRWVTKVKECIETAAKSGDMVDKAIRPDLSGWLVNQLVSGVILYALPEDSVVDYGMPLEELVKQMVLFCLRGMGLKEEAIRLYWENHYLANKNLEK